MCNRVPRISTTIITRFAYRIIIIIIPLVTLHYILVGVNYTYIIRVCNVGAPAAPQSALGATGLIGIFFFPLAPPGPPPPTVYWRQKNDNYIIGGRVRGRGGRGRRRRRRAIETREIKQTRRSHSAARAPVPVVVCEQYSRTDNRILNTRFFFFFFTYIVLRILLDSGLYISDVVSAGTTPNPMAVAVLPRPGYDDSFVATKTFPFESWMISYRPRDNLQTYYSV